MGKSKAVVKKAAVKVQPKMVTISEDELNALREKAKEKEKVRNVNMELANGKLNIEIDMKRNFGLGSTKKSELVASTGGREYFDYKGVEHCIICNVFKPVKKEKETESVS